MSRHGFVISGWIHTPFSVDVTVVGQIQAERASQLELSLCTDQMQLPVVSFTAALARTYVYACSSPHRCSLTCTLLDENLLTPKQLNAKGLK